MTSFADRAGRIGAGLVALGVLLLTSGLSLAAVAAPPSEVTLCHYAGHEGGDQYQTLTLPAAAANGHIDENGTPTAGHENDYLGACQDSESTTTVPDSTTTTADPTTTSTESTTTVPQSATTVPDSSTTTTVADQSPTTAAVEAQAVTTVPPLETTTTSISTQPETPDIGSTNEASLPFTGISLHLMGPGFLLLVVGGFAVFVSNGLGGPTGSHVAAQAHRFGLGLHRGRHQR